MNDQQLKVLFTFLSALWTSEQPFQYTVRLPKHIKGLSQNAIRLQRCALCSDKYGGVVYHKRESKCWLDRKSVINEGRTRKLPRF